MSYAGLVILSSGEPFDITKFVETLAVQVTSLVGLAATIAAGIDLSLLIVGLPKLITTLVMKAYSYYQNKKASTL